MDDRLHLRPKYRRILEGLLRELLPGVEVWAYGSRVNGRSHDGSDLDLVLRGTGLKEIPSGQVGDFEEAVRESNIPFLVEARDWTRLPERFHREIEQGYVVLVHGNETAPRSWTPLSPSTCEKRAMEDEWPCLSLREAGISLIDCEHRTPPAAECGYPYVGIPQLRDGRINLDGARRITREHFDEWTRKVAPQTFDVVLSRRCNPGETGYVPEGFEFALGQNLVLLRSDEARVLKPFLRWLVRGPKWWEQVSKYMNVGAVFDSLKCADIPDFQVRVPPLSQQRTIVHILGTLDDKIELNRRTNETLEAMARALFESWFVDFDPVRAKAQGRDPGLPRSLAALFPARLVPSELGEIPEGWTVRNLGDVAEHIRHSVQPNRIDPETPYIALDHMPKRCIALSNWTTGAGIKSNKFEFRRGDILFGKLRPYFHKVGVAPTDGVCSTDIVVVRPLQQTWLGFVLGHVSSVEFVHHTDAGSTGTRMPRTNWNEMARYRLVLPPVSIAKSFDTLTRSLVERIIANIHESRILASERDALLPKLTSGEFPVREAVNFPGETV